MRHAHRLLGHCASSIRKRNDRVLLHRLEKDQRIWTLVVWINTMNDMGWTCFQRAAPESANVLGIGDAKTLKKALRRITRRLGVTKLNCLEITEITQRSFAGISYVNLTAGARSIRLRPL